MDTLIFATNNQHKVDEIKAIGGLGYAIISLRQAGILIEIPEPYESLEENATEKSRVVHELTGMNCFSEDTGLEVQALDGEPGVKSARYAGEGRSFEKNIDKLLDRLQGKENREAQFRAVISLILEGREYKFEGICKGIILAYRSGIGGFGYDPVFVPHGATRSFAEMDTPEKNQYSHRKKAVDKMTAFLKSRVVDEQ